MTDEQLIQNFLETLSFPSKIDGSEIDSAGIRLPLVGITGTGKLHNRNGLLSSWICGEIISPNFIGNNRCACRSHIEGIVTEKNEKGEMRFLETVYDFLAHEGDCFEYLLKTEGLTGDASLRFSGEVIARVRRNEFKPRNAGNAVLYLDPHWAIREKKDGESYQSVNYSLPLHSQHTISGVYIPEFWNKFLGEIEEQGYDHPYGSVSDKLKQEREAQFKKEMEIRKGMVGDDIPF